MPPPFFRSFVGFADRNALFLPVLAALWMALISKIYGQFGFGRADFRFWWHDAAALATTAWAAGLLVRLARIGTGDGQSTSTGRKARLAVLFAVATMAAFWLGLTQVSGEFLKRGAVILSGIGFVLAQVGLENQRRSGHTLTAFISSVFVAVAIMLRPLQGETLVGLLSRFWLAGGFAMGAMPGFVAFRGYAPPVFGITRGVLSGYLFAAGVALAPLGWAGEFGLGSEVILVCAVAPVAKALAVVAWRPAGENDTPIQVRERAIAARCLPVALLASLVICGLYWHESPGGPRSLAVAVAIVCLALLLLHPLRHRKPEWCRWTAEFVLFSPLAVLWR